MNDLCLKLGSDIQKIRLLKNIDRDTLAEKAEISVRALRNLESGKATTKTLVAVMIALGKQSWLESVNPEVSINPLDKNLNRKRATGVRRREKSDIAAKRSWLKNKYGLTIKQYESMHEKQGGKCGNPGCSAKLDLSSSETCVDHNHTTGEVRSLMCSACNSALGFLSEDKLKIDGLIAYLVIHSK